MMLNEFLTRLDNRNLTFPGIIRPAFDPVALPEKKLAIWGALFGNVNSLEHFRTAIEIVQILRMTPLAYYEFEDDSRVTYNDADLGLVLAGDGVTTQVTNLTSSATIDFVRGDGIASWQSWDVVVTGADSVRSTDNDGNELEVTGITFAASGSELINLAASPATVRIFGNPNVADEWAIENRTNYNARLTGMIQRLDALPAGTIESVIPDEVRSVLENGPVLRSAVKIAAAAVGVTHGGS